MQGSIIIGGRADEATWGSAEPNGEIFVVGGVTDSDEDFPASWCGLWDDSNLYLFIEVDDDTPVVNGVGVVNNSKYRIEVAVIPGMSE